VVAVLMSTLWGQTATVFGARHSVGKKRLHNVERDPND